MKKTTEEGSLSFVKLLVICLSEDRSRYTKEAILLSHSGSFTNT